ncbi:beta-galactosidase 15-like [Mercurialis annua]|uniref:beta-galactosidase 15-like n=1 Tax=Mercurialis annua TaxID=3986 RepID=UPI0024AF9B91|nr:beta-galactosidase 15-like [Mercurialis annua]
MKQPEGLATTEQTNQLVCKLKKSIYGLKQASRQWYLKFHKVVLSFGFEVNLFEDCVYHKFSGSRFIFLVLYVDDILLASSDIELLHETKKFLSKHFEMKDLGEASFVLGIQIHRDRSRGILGLSQKGYIEKVLQRFGMQNCRPHDTPVSKGDKFSLKQCPKNELESKFMEGIPYASAVGSLMYAQVCTHPDLAFIVGMLGRYQSNPGREHWVAAKRVFRYLQNTKDYMLTYAKSDKLEIIGFSDSDFAGCQDSRKSTSGYVFLLAGGAISWKSAKQKLVTSSTMEAEFVACYEASNHVIWLHNFITGLRVVNDVERPVKLHCDNRAAVLYSNNNRSSSKSKHIDIKFLVVKERVQSGYIDIQFIGTNSMLADPLTKALAPAAFHEHIARMGVVTFDIKLIHEIIVGLVAIKTTTASLGFYSMNTYLCNPSGRLLDFGLYVPHLVFSNNLLNKNLKKLDGERCMAVATIELILVLFLEFLFFLIMCTKLIKCALTYDDRAIKIDGQRKLIISGSIHYPRSTPQMWPSLIRKANDGGLNTIETYVFWNAHEPQRRQYDFSGNLDFIRFFKTIRDEGLYAILRIGPYVCAEWTYGGLPVWLNSLPGIKLRTNNEVFKNEMKNFTSIIVDMVQREKLFASQGGPIILSQIENEYGDVESAYGNDGKDYVKWCGEMAESYKIGVPWIMCKQPDAPSPLINACNGFYCDQYDHYNKGFPKLWTENWTGWFQDWGSKVPHRPAEDVAFSVARHIQAGGSLMNYYMYHGGTNFGTTAGGPYITTSYDYDAPLDEYGNLRQPKWGHLRNLHLVLTSIEETLTNGQSSTTTFDGKMLYATVFSYKHERSCFLANAEQEEHTITFEDTDYVVPAWSVSILPDCNQEVYNTAKVTVQTSIMENRPNVEQNDLQWTWRREVIRQLDVQGAFNGSTLIANQLLDQKMVTNGSSDYLLYMTNYNHSANETFLGSDKDVFLQVQSNGHVIHAFVNKNYVGSQSANGQVKFEGKIQLKQGINSITLVSVTVGYPNYGGHYDTIQLGVSGPVKLVGRSRKGNQPEVSVDLSSNTWVYKTGLQGVDQGFHLVNPSSKYQFYTTNLLIHEPFTWYKTLFDAPVGEESVVVDLNGLGKGTAWINGNNIGRYWPKATAPNDGSCDAECSYIGDYSQSGASNSRCVTGCGEPTQRYYHVPREWLQLKDNQLVLFEEFGGTPESVSIQKVTVGKVCGKSSEGNTINLSCGYGRKFSKVNFASFGLPNGNCGSFKTNPECHVDVSSVVEKACVGKRSCSLEVSERALAPIHCYARVYTLAVEAIC